MINVKKSHFCVQRVKYFWFILDADGLSPDPDKVSAIVDFPVPKNLQELRRFLGMVGWYIRLIDGAADIKLPLLKLLHKDVPWHWGKEQQEAFQKLKDASVFAPVLPRPDFTRDFIIHLDASKFARADAERR